MTLNGGINKPTFPNYCPLQGVKLPRKRDRYLQSCAVLKLVARAKIVRARVETRHKREIAICPANSKCSEYEICLKSLG